MKITLAIFITGMCAARNNPTGPGGPSREAVACPEAENGIGCRPPPTYYDAIRQQIQIEPPPASTTLGNVSLTELRHKPKKQALRAIAQGSRFFDAGSHEQAAAQFEKARAADPKWALAHDWLGVEYSVLRRFDEARQEFQRAVDLEPNSWSGHYDFAAFLSEIGDLTGAERHARFRAGVVRD